MDEFGSIIFNGNKTQNTVHCLLFTGLYIMKLIIGLGNHPPKYHGTRHNFGWLAVDYLADRYDFAGWKFEKRYAAEINFGQIGRHKVVLCKPHTFMNLSGQSVQALRHFYKINAEDIILVSDDLDQPFGNHKFKTKGSDGGQRGLKDVIKVLGTNEFSRLKFGISNKFRSKYETSDFVTGKFTAEERDQLPEILEKGCNKLTQVLEK